MKGFIRESAATSWIGRTDTNTLAARRPAAPGQCGVTFAAAGGDAGS
jgi:hypothetical protein